MGVVAFILIAIVAFVILGLLGWGVQLIAHLFGFLGQGIMGCMGCIGQFFWYIFVGLILLALVVALI